MHWPAYLSRLASRFPYSTTRIEGSRIGHRAARPRLMREVLVDALAGENGPPGLARAAGGPNRWRPIPPSAAGARIARVGSESNRERAAGWRAAAPLTGGAFNVGQSEI
jgi:hypothetical protein